MKGQSRREFLKALGFVGGSAVGLSMMPGCARAARALGSSAEQPNIIYIMTDDHASHSMSCYGSRINKTPNLDRIAKEGMRFDNCFCTNSICAPCRAVVLTGKHSHINGVIDNRKTFDGTQDRPDGV